MSSAEHSTGEKVYDFGVGIPSKSLQIGQSLICKTFSVWSDPSTKDEYHEAADYGLTQIFLKLLAIPERTFSEHQQFI